jgi:hypothetical protein
VSMHGVNGVSSIELSIELLRVHYVLNGHFNASHFDALYLPKWWTNIIVTVSLMTSIFKSSLLLKM